ncbi:S15 RNA-binding [Micractinium conductrix]|uniref:S15 RNA-binding n=1 Tax=Micractinium conductrix TaxID=554055 RepID=A0A2P6VD39_9CHLO|nr:S15 RNA-binding [Micractinium conductrix]|eukprot:PSC72005.1 S15 RNA-binding [Micractinium conductrix]
MEDVQRISRGDAARARGTGSRAVPHRLNAEERAAFEVARKKWVLALAGSGYRRERKGSPLANLWRQWCDAAGMPCVLVCKGATAAAGDTVLVDLSTLRLRDTSQYQEACRAVAAQHGVAPLPLAPQQSPFTVILPPALVDALMEVEEGGGGGGSSRNQRRSSSSSSSSLEPAVAVAGGAAECAAETSPSEAAAVPPEAGDTAVDAAAAAGGGNGSTTGTSVQEGSTAAVQELLAELRCGAPIWQHPPLLHCFNADRTTAKALSKQLADELRQLAPAGSA